MLHAVGQPSIIHLKLIFLWNGIEKEINKKYSVATFAAMRISIEGAADYESHWRNMARSSGSNNATIFQSSIWYYVQGYKPWWAKGREMLRECTVASLFHIVAACFCVNIRGRRQVNR